MGRWVVMICPVLHISSVRDKEKYKKEIEYLSAKFENKTLHKASNDWYNEKVRLSIIKTQSKR